MSAADELKLRMGQQSMVDVNLQEKSEFREKLELLTAAVSQGEGTGNNLKKARTKLYLVGIKNTCMHNPVLDIAQGC